MAPPSGVGIPPGQCLHSSRGRYGLKQATHDWHERCVSQARIQAM